MKINTAKLVMRSAMFVVALAIAGYFTLAPARANADACSGGAKCQIVGDGGPVLCCKTGDVVATE
jgi:hypothetical protein